MKIKNVNDILADHGFSAPDLEILDPRPRSYRCLLLQPKGPIYAGTDRIGCHESAQGKAKAQAFFELAVQKKVHLAVTPEYYCPWDTLKNAIKEKKPPKRGLWIVGCESINETQLEEFKLSIKPHCVVIHEPFDELDADRELLDPVVILFHSTGEDWNGLIALIQFKVRHSRDELFFEQRVLREGNWIYQFLGGKTPELKLSILICSDALTLDQPNDVKRLIDRGTLIHIQLNPDPRHTVYKNYRKIAFEADTRSSDCHIVCLNWAQPIEEYNSAGVAKNWPENGGSAWYLPDDACTSDAASVQANHFHGLYYTYLKESRRHALFFNQDEAAFELLVPKVATDGPAVNANRNGPTAEDRHIWNDQTQQWMAATHPADCRYAKFLSEHRAAAALAAIPADTNVVDLEKLFALTAGGTISPTDWQYAKAIDSFHVSHDEVVKRITVALEKNTSAVNFRQSRLSAVAYVRQILDRKNDWPPQLSGLNSSAKVHWDTNLSCFNVKGSDGKPALVAYIGDVPHLNHIKNTVSALAELLRIHGGPYQHRLGVAFNNYGSIDFADIPYTRFDIGNHEETDFANVTSL